MSSFILHCHLQCWDFQFLHTKPTFVIVFLFNYSHPSECKISYCSLIFISLMSNIEHLFMYLMHIYLFFLRNAYVNPLLIFYWFICLFIVELKSSLYYSQYYFFIRFWICKYFLPFFGLCFHLLNLFTRFVYSH